MREVKIMKILIHAINVGEQCDNLNYKGEFYNLDYIENKTTLLAIKNLVGIPEYIGITFDSYYNDTSCTSNFNNTLPYVVKINGKIDWNVNIDNTLISEFINTHNIDSENGIKFEYGFPQAGGSGFKDVLEVWNQIYPFIQIMANIGGAIAFIEFVKTTFKKNIPVPHDIINYLYKREFWNHHELAKILDTSEENAKKLLITFGYKWNNSKKIYIINSNVKRKIMKIKKQIRFLEG